MIYCMKMTTGPGKFSRSSKSPSMNLSHTNKFRSFQKALFPSPLFSSFFFSSLQLFLPY